MIQNGYSQKLHDSLLIGSWLTSKVYDKEKYLDETLSFYLDGKFQVNRTFYKGYNGKGSIISDVSIGKWLIKNKRIIFYSQATISDTAKSYFQSDPYFQNIFKLTDSALVFRERNTNEGPRGDFYLTEYKKVNDVELVEIKRLPYFYGENLYLINSVSNKKVKIKIGLVPTFFLDIDTAQYVEVESYHSIQATFFEGNDSVFVLNVSKEEEHYVKKDHSYSGKSTSDENEPETRIKPETIIGLKYRSPVRGICDGLSFVITPLSIATALIVAPLASINYKTGGFNAQRYYTIAASGLIGLSIGIPLHFIGRVRYYDITTKRGEKAKDLWYFDNLPLGK